MTLHPRCLGIFPMLPLRHNLPRWQVPSRQVPSSSTDSYYTSRSSWGALSVSLSLLLQRTQRVTHAFARES